MINRDKLQHILEYARQQRHIGLHCKVPPEDMVEIVEMAMLQGADGNAPAHFRSRPAQSSLSPAQGGNSPVIPDGWVMLPAEPTQAMMNAWLSEVANWRGHAAGYRAMIAAAPQQEAKNV